MKQIRVAVIGYGVAGQIFHAPLIASNAQYELAMIVTGNEDRAAAARSSYPNAQVVAETAAVFEEAAGIDLVVIASPHHTHVPYATMAVARGKDVVIDKPIAPSSKAARELMAEATALGRIVTVFQNRRWDGDYLTVKAVIESGVLGEIFQFESAFSWREEFTGAGWKETTPVSEGGGITYDLAPHLMDQAIGLFGTITDLHGELDSRNTNGVNDDDSFITMRHESGIRTRLWMSKCHDLTRPRFRVVGSLGTLESYGLDPQEGQLAAGQLPGSLGFGIHPEFSNVIVDAGERSVTPKVAGEYQTFYAELARCIAERGVPPVAAQDAISVLELIEVVTRDFGTDGGGPTPA